MFERIWRAWHNWDVDRRIRRHGWTAIYVGDYDDTAAWTYTVGFDETLDMPEIIIFDIPQADANAVVWQVFQELKAGTLVLEDGGDWSADSSHPCVWRRVHPSQLETEGWVNLAAMRRAGRTGHRDGLAVFQLVLSDPDGRLPWQPGYDETIRRRQPALYLPINEAFPPLAPHDGV